MLRKSDNRAKLHHIQDHNINLQGLQGLKTLTDHRILIFHFI